MPAAAAAAATAESDCCTSSRTETEVMVNSQESTSNADVVLMVAQNDPHCNTDFDIVASIKYRELLAAERLRSEIQVLGGLMVALGIGAALSTMALISSLLEGMSGMAQVDGFLLPVLVGNFLQLVCGMTAMGTGLWAMMEVSATSLLKNNSHGGATRFHRSAQIAVGIINLGPITFIITLVRLIQGADEPPELQPFIPMSLNPIQADIRMCVAMGVLVLISVCGAIIGGLTVLGLHLCADLGGQPHSRHRAYHIIRAAYYNILVILGALAQLVLGGYLWGRFGFGPYDEPVHVATFTIHFPVVAVVVGTLQLMMGVLGFCRSVGWRPIGDESDKFFTATTGCVWISSIFLQVVFQPAYSSDPFEYNAEGSTVAGVYVGFFIMPMYLDYLIRTTPQQPRPEYYGLPPDAYYKEDFLVKWLGMVPSQNGDSGTSGTSEQHQRQQQEYNNNLVATGHCLEDSSERSGGDIVMKGAGPASTDSQSSSISMWMDKRSVSELRPLSLDKNITTSTIGRTRHRR
jgi:hypothetical protein